MTIKQALTLSSDLETDLLLSHIISQPKEFLFLHPEYKLSSRQLTQLKQFIKRRKNGEPIAYILGYKYFYGLKFFVTKDVLIPRPETELLVDRVITLAKGRPLNIIDVGTGSGCIAISLAKNLPKAKVYASDVSSPALTIARKNAKALKAKVVFERSYLLKSVKGQFDLLIANLPYVPKADYRKLKNNLKYEPRLALVDESGKFSLYDQLFAQLPLHLTNNARVFLEIDPTAKSPITNYLKKLPQVRQLEFTQDFQRLWRFAEFSWSPIKSPRNGSK